MNPIYCIKCKKELQADDTFCRFCGASQKAGILGTEVAPIPIMLPITPESQPLPERTKQIPAGVIATLFIILALDCWLSLSFLKNPLVSSRAGSASAKNNESSARSFVLNRFLQWFVQDNGYYTTKYKNGEDYNGFVQFHELDLKVIPKYVSDADKLNGIEDKYTVEFWFAAIRKYPDSKSSWSEWSKADAFDYQRSSGIEYIPIYRAHINKRNGAWIVTDDKLVLTDGQDFGGQGTVTETVTKPETSEVPPSN